jgi:hypothetical protein
VSQPVTNVLARIRIGFQNAGIPDNLIDALFDAYTEAKRRFYLGDLRPNEVEGGWFAEAAFRILELKVFGTHTPIGKSLPTVDNLVKRLESTGGKDPALTVHIPRALHSIYTIRNKRDVAHLGPDVSPNLQDATFVVGVMDWVLAEFVRLYHQVSNNEAQQIIDGLVKREVPAIQVFGSYPKLLKTVTLPEHLLILLYWAGRGRRNARGTVVVDREGNNSDSYRTREIQRIKSIADAGCKRRSAHRRRERLHHDPRPMLGRNQEARRARLTPQPDNVASVCWPAHRAQGRHRRRVVIFEQVRVNAKGHGHTRMAHKPAQL